MPIPHQEYKAIREDILKTVIEAAERSSVSLDTGVTTIRRYPSGLSHEREYVRVIKMSDFISHLSKSLTPPETK